MPDDWYLPGVQSALHKAALDAALLVDFTTCEWADMGAKNPTTINAIPVRIRLLICHAPCKPRHIPKPQLCAGPAARYCHRTRQVSNGSRAGTLGDARKSAIYV